MPVEPEPSRWQLDLSQAQPEDDLVGVGADLEPGTLLRAYRAGLFPMGLGRHGRGPIGWWSPDPRGVLLPGDLKVSKSLRRSCRRFEVRVDTAFTDVMRACADSGRDGRWITPAVVRAYTALHQLGWAHSVETWQDGELVGGLYGLAVGGLFAGESMFHHATDASKVALVALVGRLKERGYVLFDVQILTRHTESLGAVEMPRDEYLSRLEAAVGREVTCG